jgi:non-specific serine/threonine protein kinase
LKPGNVLVSGEAGKLHLRLTDFGSGQVLDRARLEALQLTASGFTQTHDVAADSRTGTFAYMAPELLAGQSPTLQSDVYALGLMLYQLLAGDLRRPLATGWERDVDDELLREDIRAATEGRSDERLGSATELLARLEQLSPRRTARAAQLDRERQSAELLARQQRHRARLPWVLAALGLLALGLISSLTLYARERLALAAAKVETRRADAFVEFLTKDVLASDDLSRVGGLKPASILDVLRRAEASVSGRFAGQPLLEAKVRHHLSKVFLRLTSHSDAENQLQLAVRLLRSLPNGNELVLADVLLDGVSLYLSRHYIEGAVQALEEAEHLGGTALREPAGNLARHHARARTQLLLEQGKVEMALAEANRLSEMMQNFEAVPLDEQFEISRIRAEALVASGDFAAANKLLAGLARPPFGIERVGEATYFRAVTRIASALTVSGRAKEAERLVLDLLGSLEEQTPISEWHVGSANNLLGMIGERLGNYADSAHRLENAMRTFQGLFGENHENTRIVEMNLATAYLHLGRWKDALTLCERVRPWARGEKQAERERVLKSLSARALIGLDRPREALVELGDVSVDLVTRKISTPTDDFGLIALAFRGMALMDSGRFAEGKQLLGETLRRIKPSGEPSPAFEKSWDAYMKRSR